MCDYYSPSQREGDLSASVVHDPAFEPHSTFTFDEPSNEEEIRNMKRNITSINMMGDVSSHSPFDPMSVQTSGAPGQVHQQFQPDFVSPFLFDQADVSSESPSWQNVQTLPGNLRIMSMQEDILRGRNGSATHRFGQITPPNDTPKASASANQTPASTAPPDVSGSIAKSERARNAANQRHAKAKKARKDSVRKAETPEGDEEEVDDKREKYREKNRLAAAKCRAKKKVNTEDLEQSAREATARNNQLRAEERHLRDMFSSLRDQALAHDPTQGCNCSAIHSYNMHQAQKAVRGAALGFHGGTMPSPSQRSVDSGSPSTIASSRTHSFTGMRPQFSKHPVRTQSIGNQMAFQQTTAGDMSQSDYAMASSTAEPLGQHIIASAGENDSFPEYLRQSSNSHQMNFR